ncbi:glucosaminidase domain-containing protein [Polaribacter sp. IC073]|uniref:glucosaminidase domain-containing protein n=1 Tax=Polaribacter sp. IC073 TaxID=2508540 RepID=UPI0011BEB1A8|nr:glucosaminidase domain-containing protein [Polaribacter sp. IC073]TXD47603.1 LysM peptidoglycan-binding domain-containing protein [Polaribacter sp. IC073]
MKLRIVFSCLFLVVLYSCGSKKKVVNKKNPGVVIVEPAPVDLPSVNEVDLVKKLSKSNPRLNKQTLAYIRKYAPIAVKEMHEYKIPASITLAQGILESGKGRSELALKSNNHFGIKCHSQWTGERVYHDDDEKGECFRKYVYPETSYNDHSLFLTERRRYAFLFDYNIRNYKKWAYGLRKAGYATDRQYPAKLLRIIKEYELYEFDKIKKGKYSRQIKELNNGRSFEKPMVIEKLKGNFYAVQKGDTLYAISRMFKISVTNLKAINNLNDNIISVGQQLLVKKQ